MLGLRVGSGSLPCGRLCSCTPLTVGKPRTPGWGLRHHSSGGIALSWPPLLGPSVWGALPHPSSRASVSPFRVTAPRKPSLTTVPTHCPAPPQLAGPESWPPSPTSLGAEQLRRERQQRQLCSGHTSVPAWGTANKAPAHLCATASASDPVPPRLSGSVGERRREPAQAALQQTQQSLQEGSEGVTERRNARSGTPVVHLLSEPDDTH